MLGNRDFVEQTTLELQHDELIAEAVSYLYAAMTIRFAIGTAQPLSLKSDMVLALANRFGFYIPNTFDICGSDRGEECIIAIDKYAREFSKLATS